MLGRIRVLKFLTLFAVGGTEKQFVHVSKHLDRSRFDLHIGCLERQGAFLKELEALGVPIGEYRTNSLYSYRTPLKQLQLARYIGRERIQVVHSYGLYPILFTTPAAKLARKPVLVASVRDTGVYLTPAKRRVQRAMLAMADCVLANSKAVRDWVVSEGIDSRVVRVIPNGIEIPERKPSNFRIRNELGIPAGTPLGIVVCRMTPSKGIEYLIEAVQAVILRFPEFRVLLVGENGVDPTYRPSLEKRVASLNLERYMLFTGWRNDIPELLQESNLSILPSLSEGLSNTILESMAAGLPVVATDVGGNPELIDDGKTGLLVQPRDAASLAHGILRILESPMLARRFGDAAREDVARRFSIESTTRQTEDLYTDLVHQNNRGQTPHSPISEVQEIGE